jgi:uncharacterized metal-binding protein
MPSGRTHDSITLWCLPPLALVGWQFTRDGTLVLILCGCFLFSGLMFGPDLDIYSQQYKRWLCLRWVWLPYRRSMSHRSVLSHGMVIGTVLRVAYVVTIVLFLAICGYFLWAVSQQFAGWIPAWHLVFNPWLDGWLQRIAASLRDHLGLWIAGFIGLELGSISHSLSDQIGSAIKRHQRQKQGGQKLGSQKLGGKPRSRKSR